MRRRGGMFEWCGLTIAEQQNSVEAVMKNRLSATQARKIATNAPVKRIPLKSPVWDKHKGKVLAAAMSGQTEYLIATSDAGLTKKIEKLGMTAVEVFRNKEIEKLRADFALEYQQVEEKRKGWYDALKGLIQQEKNITNKWPELRYFLDCATPFLDEYLDALRTEDDQFDDFNLNEIEQKMEEESVLYDYDLSFEQFVKNVHSYPSKISGLIQQIISDEDNYYPVRCKRERLDGSSEWDNDGDDETESEDDRLFYSYKCPLPQGVDHGIIVKWDETSHDLIFSKCTGQINGEMLSWVSSKAGQTSISEVEREVEKASRQKKTHCTIVLKVGEADPAHFFEYEFPSFEIFRTVFESLQYNVILKGSLNHALGQSETIKVSMSWEA